MPVLGDTKVIVESLFEFYDRLVLEIQSEAARGLHPRVQVVTPPPYNGSRGSIGSCSTPGIRKAFHHAPDTRPGRLRAGRRWLRRQARQDRRREQLGNPYVVFIGVMIAAIVVVIARPAHTAKADPDDFGSLFRRDRRHLPHQSDQRRDPAGHAALSSSQGPHGDLERLHDLHVLHLRLDAAPDQGRFSVHHPVRRVLQGGQRRAPPGAGHLGRDRRPDRRRRRDPRDRSADGRPPVRAPGAAEHRR